MRGRALKVGINAIFDSYKYKIAKYESASQNQCWEPKLQAAPLFSFEY